MLRKVWMILFSSAAGLCGAYAQQVAPRIAGLEDNEEYMSLLREDARLQMREDSVSNELAMLFGRLEIFGLVQLFFIKWWR